jgi:hypothetical protein
MTVLPPILPQKTDAELGIAIAADEIFANARTTMASVFFLILTTLIVTHLLRDRRIAERFAIAAHSRFAVILRLPHERTGTFNNLHRSRVRRGTQQDIPHCKHPKQCRFASNGCRSLPNAFIGAASLSTTIGRIRRANHLVGPQGRGRFVHRPP